MPEESFNHSKGFCPVCEPKKILFSQHKKCESCGILVGDQHIESSLRFYRGHKICGYCYNSWKRRANLTWAQFCEPKTTKLTERELEISEAVANYLDEKALEAKKNKGGSLSEIIDSAREDETVKKSGRLTIIG